MLKLSKNLKEPEWLTPRIKEDFTVEVLGDGAVRVTPGKKRLNHHE